AGVSRAQSEGYLRASVVNSPCFDRVNTGDNSPAMLHTELVAGDGLMITVLPKGAGSENMSRLAMLKPADGVEGLVAFVVETVELAGANACPPIFLGVGLGGTMDRAAFLAKQALIRPAGAANADARLAGLEQQILERVNALGIGPGGFGGTVTCLGVAIEEYPCHIASLPVAVNIQCNAARRAAGGL
ncbi:MAG: fumarate hydratase, partial [Thermoleophilia bacterium]